MGRCSIAPATPRPVVLRAPADFDAVSAPGLRDELAMLLSHDAPAIVVEMHDVEFLDSSGMGALVAARKLAIERGASFSLRGVGPKVAASLRIAGLLDFLDAREGD